MNIILSLLVGLLLSGTAVAEEEAPEFLLGDLGVRVDLPQNWNMLRWSDWDFKAETTDQQVMLVAWGTPTQLSPDETNLDGWAPLFEAAAAEMGGEDISVNGAMIEQTHGVASAHFDLGFTYKNRGMVLYGATLPVFGQMIHVATVGRHARRSTVESALDEVVSTLDIHKPAAELSVNVEQEANGVEVTLPNGWREPLMNEASHALNQIKNLGIEDIEPCALGMQPQAGQAPKVMVTCQGGMWLGVVDDYTFDDVDVVLRERMFGNIPVPPAERVELTDRLGFIYDVDVPDGALVMSVVPYDKGLARTWIVGGENDREALHDTLRALLMGAEYSGEHPASVGDRASYYLAYRPFHPVVLGSGLAVLGFVTGLGWLAMGRRRNPYADFDE